MMKLQRIETGEFLQHTHCFLLKVSVYSLGTLEKFDICTRRQQKTATIKTFFFMFIGKYSNFQSSEIKGCKGCTIWQFSNSSNYLAYLLQMQFIIDYGGTILSIKK